MKKIKINRYVLNKNPLSRLEQILNEEKLKVLSFAKFDGTDDIKGIHFGCVISNINLKMFNDIKF